MNSTKWKEIAEFLGIAAIILGLYLVYEEIRLNGTVARAELSAETHRNLVIVDQFILNPDIANAYLKSLQDPESLTAVERLQVNIVLQSVLRQYRRECYYQEIGIFSECESVPRRTAVKYFGSRYGRAFWKTVRHRMVGPRITAIIDRELSNTPADNMHSLMDESILNNLANP